MNFLPQAAREYLSRHSPLQTLGKVAALLGK
jgi:hypothetical protein